MNDPIRQAEPLSFPWQTLDPFLFCAYHDDAYPAAREDMSPDASLAGRNIGMDFEGVDGWRMYHGQKVPGFPQHPHRGFETVTLVRKGLIDHSDSMGATARFGGGDAQWMTAGKGIVHSEMFPLLNRDGTNPLELFQIWINLPAADKMVDPYFSMYWAENMQTHEATDAAGKKSWVTVLTGSMGESRGVQPPPNSWAAREAAAVSIWTVRLEPGARLTLPAAASDLNRALYFFRGSSVRIGERTFSDHYRIILDAGQPVELTAGEDECEFLFLEGRPIAEPVAQYGPFVMNYGHEIQQAMRDYQMTGFGGWPWPQDDPVHARETPRFAHHADGREEIPPIKESAGKISGSK